MPEPAIPIEHCTTPADVERLAAAARATGRIGLDTEFLWERTYAPVPCLVQVATADRIAIVDPLIPGVELAPIAAIVADPAVEIVMHAPAADLVLFARRFGIRPTRVFDVQLVAGFVGLGTSLAYDRLVERVLHVRLVHNETFSNWVKRPLSATQIAYAADDVRHLHALADALRREVAARGRDTWVADELARRYGPTAAPDPRQAYLKLARRGRLSGRQLALLREIAAWREREAETSDLPVGWVLKDPTLVEMARTMPRDADAIAQVRGASGLSGAARARLVRAITAGVEAEPIEPPREAPREIARRVAAASELAAVLLRARCDAADLASELVATRGDLERYVELVLTGGDAEHPLASGWRAEIVGRELRELVEGRIALASLARSPYLDVIRR